MCRARGKVVDVGNLKVPGPVKAASDSSRQGSQHPTVAGGRQAPVSQQLFDLLSLEEVYSKSDRENANPLKSLPVLNHLLQSLAEWSDLLLDRVLALTVCIRAQLSNPLILKPYLKYWSCCPICLDQHIATFLHFVHSHMCMPSCI